MRRRSRTSTTSTIATPLDFQSCPAKTFVTKTGAVTCGRSVFNHCQIVGEVAHTLLGQYCTALKARLFPEGSALVAACHDIGKVSPTFVEKLYRASGRGRHSHPSLIPFEPEMEKRWGGVIVKSGVQRSGGSPV